MGETLEEGLSERLCERLVDRFGEMLCNKLCAMLDADMLQVYCRQASSRFQESYNLSQLPSPDKGFMATKILFFYKNCIYL